MNNNLVKEITARQLRTDIPSFRSGDTIKVYVRIIENKKERNQVFEGVVMQRRGSGVSATFTVRKISAVIGVLEELDHHLEHMVPELLARSYPGMIDVNHVIKELVQDL